MRKEYNTTQTLEINASPEDCYRLICDFEAYPQWFRNVRKVMIDDAGEDGVPRRAHYVFDIAIKQGFQIVLEYEYEDAKCRLNYRSVGGHFKDADGYYQFRRLTTGKTLAEFQVRVYLGVVLPSKITSYLIDEVQKGVLKMMKKELEKKES
jgi:ribosome-associated toxin RatA of RatAB toxin-antitoxin module